MTYKHFTLSLFTAFIITSACNSEKITTEPIQLKPFPEKNIPEHIFKQNIKSFRDTIQSLFNFDNHFENKILTDIFGSYFNLHDSIAHRSLISFSAETMENPIFGKEYFSKPNTINDIYIHCFGEAWLSGLYYSKGQPLEYRTAFSIKLSKVDSTSTKVTIIAENPKVLNGVSNYSAHGPVARETTVESSTIEEYSLLLFIANKLGDTTLAPIKLPGNH